MNQTTSQINNFEDKVLYKTSYNWTLTLLFSSFIGSFYFIVSVISELAGIIYIVCDVLLMLTFVSRKFVFYENRVEMVRLIKFFKNKTYKYQDIIKIEYKSGVPRVPPEIFIVTKVDNSKEHKDAFLAPSVKKTKFLLKELHNRGINITFNCNESVRDAYKSW